MTNVLTWYTDSIPINGKTLIEEITYQKVQVVVPNTNTNDEDIFRNDIIHHITQSSDTMIDQMISELVILTTESLNHQIPFSIRNEKFRSIINIINDNMHPIEAYTTHTLIRINFTEALSKYSRAIYGLLIDTLTLVIGEAAIKNIPSKGFAHTYKEREINIHKWLDNTYGNNFGTLLLNDIGGKLNSIKQRLIFKITELFAYISSTQINQDQTDHLTDILMTQDTRAGGCSRPIDNIIIKTLQNMISPNHDHKIFKAPLMEKFENTHHDLSNKLKNISQHANIKIEHNNPNISTLVLKDTFSMTLQYRKILNRAFRLITMKAIEDTLNEHEYHVQRTIIEHTRKLGFEIIKNNKSTEENTFEIQRRTEICIRYIEFTINMITKSKYNN